MAAGSRRSASAARSSPGCSSISSKTRPPIGSTPAIANWSSWRSRCATPRKNGKNSTANCRSPKARCRCGCSMPSGIWPSWNACCRSRASGAKRPRKSPRPNVGSSWPRKSTRPRSPIGRASCGRLGCRTTIHPDDLATMAGQHEQLEQLREKIENRREDADAPPARARFRHAADRRARRRNRPATRKS